MCPPKFFRIAYSINPWMNRELVDTSRAHTQWQTLRYTLELSGVDVKVIEPRYDHPDMVFTANAGLVHGNKVVLSNFKHPEREGEQHYFRDWFLDHGYDVYDLPYNLKFEGRGDCFIHKGKLIGGYGFRSDRKAIKMAAEILDLKPVIFKLQDPRFYHLDTCLSIVDEENDVAIYYPGAFSRLRKPNWGTGLKLLPVEEWEAERFVCNSVTVGNNIIMPARARGTKIMHKLKASGYNVAEVHMSEFMKSGGAARCLVLEL